VVKKNGASETPFLPKLEITPKPSLYLYLLYLFYYFCHKPYAMASALDGLHQQKEINIQKLNYLRKEYAIASDAGVKFTVQMQIEEVEKEMKEIEKIIPETIQKHSDTKNEDEMLPQIQTEEKLVTQFFEKIDLAKRFIANGETSQAIQTMRQTSDRFERELLMLSSRLHDYQRFYEIGKIDHHGLAYERGRINDKLIDILDKMKFQ
jgi:hypothetical protein